MDGVARQPGFTIKPNRKAIEIFIQGYLKLITSGNRLREERKFIKKAIVMINQVLGHPCCDDPNSVINFITPYDNQLTNTIRNLITNEDIIRRSFRLSLFRILDILNKYLYGCCYLNIVDFDSNIITNNNAIALFDVNNRLIGILNDGYTPLQFVTLWNTSLVNNSVGTLVVSTDGKYLLNYNFNIPHISYLRVQNLFIFL